MQVLPMCMHLPNLSILNIYKNVLPLEVHKLAVGNLCS